jgi:hypothetical protein
MKSEQGTSVLQRKGGQGTLRYIQAESKSVGTNQARKKSSVINPAGNKYEGNTCAGKKYADNK